VTPGAIWSWRKLTLHNDHQTDDPLATTHAPAELQTYSQHSNSSNNGGGESNGSSTGSMSSSSNLEPNRTLLGATEHHLPY